MREWMYMIKPIPKAVLKHTVQYKEYIGESRYGKEYKESITLHKVLVQPISGINKTANVNTVMYNTLMFYDCTNSQPSNVEFTKESLIIFNGREMEISKVSPMYAFDLHHYEIGLI